MNLRFRKLLLLALSALLLKVVYTFTASFCDRQTDGFSMAKIHSDLSYDPKWETTPLSLEKQNLLNEALSQKFHYLGCGGQCFAFASEDDRYVIKFFKHKIRKPYSYFLKTSLGPLDALRLPKLNKALRKLNRDFTSYKIAYEDLQDETGLIYIHLNKGTSLCRSLTIIDKLGIEHQVPLDEVEFIVQAHAQLLYSRIEDLMAHGDADGARQALHAILELIVSRCKKGVFDEDPRLHRNFGFTGNKPIFIDVGRFVRDPLRKECAVYKADLHDITKRFRDYLNMSHPELVSTLDKALYEFEAQD